MQNISVIIPTLNEAGNLTILIGRIDKALSKARVGYEVVVIDDHSSDETVKVARKLTKKFPVRVYLKQGQQGKAQSIIEGVARAKYGLVGVIDADLQYPPEALAAMVAKVKSGEAEVVVGKRVEVKTSKLRKVVSWSFRRVFGEWLHGLKVDVQSGLKVFPKELLDYVDTKKVTPWTLDLPLLIRARDLGYKMGEVKISFEPRVYGESKVKVVASSMEIGWQAAKQKFVRKTPVVIAPSKKMIGAGVRLNGQKFVTHTTLPQAQSALVTATDW